jgi:hypothetical protein
MSKGSRRRPEDIKAIEANWGRTFSRDAEGDEAKNALIREQMELMRVAATRSVKFGKSELVSHVRFENADGDSVLSRENVGDMGIPITELAMQVQPTRQAAMLCRTCSHVSDIMECKNPDVVVMFEPAAKFLVHSDFGCNRWEAT